jgi:plasmid maintenance system antidote protein VapI
MTVKEAVSVNDRHPRWEDGPRPGEGRERDQTGSYVRELAPKPSSVHEALHGTESYRDVLTAALDERRSRNPRYSQSAFARELGLRRSQLHEVLGGKKGLSRSAAQRIASIVGLDGDDAELFCDLIDAEHARSEVTRTWARRQLERRGRVVPPPPRAPDAEPDLSGTWIAVSRTRSSGPCSNELQVDSWQQTWTFTPDAFQLVSTHADGESVVEGRYELQGSLLLLTVDREEGDRSRHGAGRRHYVEDCGNGELLLRTPGANLPSDVCEPGGQLETRLRRNG